MAPSGSRQSNAEACRDERKQPSQPIFAANAMPQSAIIVPVPEAESRVGALRDRFDPTARQGVPAHITILFPFMSPTSIDEAVRSAIRKALARTTAFNFQLHQVRRFPATTWLAPEPARPFIAMTRSLARAFPAFPPSDGAHDAVVPHLTVAHGDAQEADAAAAELSSMMSAEGPVLAVCGAVLLIENSTGRWKPMHRFDLAQRE